MGKICYSQDFTLQIFTRCQLFHRTAADVILLLFMTFGQGVYCCQSLYHYSEVFIFRLTILDKECFSADFCIPK